MCLFLRNLLTKFSQPECSKVTLQSSNQAATSLPLKDGKIINFVIIEATDL